MDKNEQRLKALTQLIWDTRWVSEDDDYHNLVGIAAEINSGNFNSIDKIIEQKQTNQLIESLTV